ncbi:DUF7010 family protein [Undibacterium curvum]|uniref:DUF7010 family protein n=1 Tax=Undibacterium curvum TaxID=2762294 RepID=UPI003D0A745F
MPNLNMTIADAQRDMRSGYMSGAPGMFASATVWAIASIVALEASANKAVFALFFGAMLIHPLSVLLCKAFGRKGSHTKDNPLASLAMENTLWLIFSCPIAYGVSLTNIAWFFPAMLLVIAGRFFTFHTLYGIRTYWFCGGTLALAAYVLAASNTQPYISALAGCAIEFTFGVFILISDRREKQSRPARNETPGGAS